MIVNGYEIKSDANLSGADLKGADLRYADLIDANLRNADLRNADLVRSNLSSANLRHADLSHANLRDANLSGVNLSDANLNNANLRDADLRGANLRCANLKDADLSGAILRNADLSGANLSGAKMFSAKEWLKKFEHTKDGIVVYKDVKSNFFKKPASWMIEEGSFLEENCNTIAANDCGCGVSFATLDWLEKYSYEEIWKCIILWEDVHSIVVPYNTDGKARCGRLKLIETYQPMN